MKMMAFSKSKRDLEGMEEWLEEGIGGAWERVILGGNEEVIHGVFFSKERWGSKERWDGQKVSQEIKDEERQAIVRRLMQWMWMQDQKREGRQETKEAWIRRRALEMKEQWRQEWEDWAEWEAPMCKSWEELEGRWGNPPKNAEEWRELWMRGVQGGIEGGRLLEVLWGDEACRKLKEEGINVKGGWPQWELETQRGWALYGGAAVWKRWMINEEINKTLEMSGEEEVEWRLKDWFDLEHQGIVKEALKSREGVKGSVLEIMNLTNDNMLRGWWMDVSRKKEEVLDLWNRKGEELWRDQKLGYFLRGGMQEILQEFTEKKSQELKRMRGRGVEGTAAKHNVRERLMFAINEAWEDLWGSWEPLNETTIRVGVEWMESWEVQELLMGDTITILKNVRELEQRVRLEGNEGLTRWLREKREQYEEKAGLSAQYWVWNLEHAGKIIREMEAKGRRVSEAGIRLWIEEWARCDKKARKEGGVALERWQEEIRSVEERAKQLEREGDREESGIVRGIVSWNEAQTLRGGLMREKAIQKKGASARSTKRI